MATKKRRRPQRASTALKDPPVQEYSARKNFWSVILFAAAVFLLFVVLVSGQSAWNYMHRFTLGLFGIVAFFWPLLLGYIAIMFALDKPISYIRSKAVVSIALVTLIGAAIYIFSAHLPAETFWQHLRQAYINGEALHGGGFIGSLFGQPIFLLFGKIGAGVTIVLLIFVMFMLMTGTTLIMLFKTVAKPVKKIEQTAGNMYVTHKERRQERERINVDVPFEEGGKFNVDVPIGEQPITGEEHAAAERFDSNIEEKQQRVINTYRDEEPLPEMSTMGKPVLDDALLEKINQKATVKPDKPKEEKFTPPEGSGITVEVGAEEYRYPPISLLKRSPAERTMDIKNELTANAEKLVDTLKSFGVETRVIDISRGPSVTRYELQPAAGVKISRITNLADDIALNLATIGVRIEAPIPNKAAVGIEVPNKIRSSVGLRELVESTAFQTSKGRLSCVLGKDISGNICLADISKMPHVLIAGTTGSGKSVCLNSIIVSLLYKYRPDEVKMIMIDPKAVEMNVYNGIPHLLVPVVTDPRKAAGALGWAVTEMLNRYKILRDNNVRNLESYNKLAKNSDTLNPLPQIVVIIDELSDLMMAAPNEVEDSICRLAQMARAAGMHLVIATQRPSVDVITGLIKANIPSRIALTVSTQIDSRTILDMGGAEKLIGKGDMLYYPVGAVKPTRIQGCWVSDGEIEALIEFLKGKQETTYDEEVMQEIERQAVAEKPVKGNIESEDSSDAMLPQAIECVIDAGQASTSLLQRKLKLGYARAARIIDQMEERNIVGPYEGSKPRQVLLSRQQWMEMQAMGRDEEL